MIMIWFEVIAFDDDYAEIENDTSVYVSHWGNPFRIRYTTRV